MVRFPATPVIDPVDIKFQSFEIDRQLEKDLL